MATRLYLTADRMMLSKPGFNASPALADQNKIFDSEWGYAGLVGEIVAFTDPAPPSYAAFATDDSSPLTINFSRTYPIIPSVVFTQNLAVDPAPSDPYTGGPIDNRTLQRANNEQGLIWRVYDNRAVMTRQTVQGSGGYWRISESSPVILMVFAW